MTISHNITINGAAGYAASVSSGGSGSGDPDWGNVSLLLTGDDLLDHSATPKTLTVNGNTSVNTATKKFGASSLSFDGSTGYMTIPSSNDFVFGTNNFTIECWINTTDAKAYSGIINDNSYHTTTSNFLIMLNQVAGKVTFWKTDTVLCTSATSINTGSWVHLAVVRDTSTSVKMFINGVLDTSATIASNLTFGTGTGLLVGNQNGFARTLQGYLDDIRITKGVARYTTNFTPPTAALPIGAYVAGTSTPVADPSTSKYVSLLLNGDGTNGAQNQTFIDSSSNNATITRYGDATQGSFGPFGNSWSNYFDGSAGYMAIPDSTAFDLSGGTFTVEAWVNLSSFSMNPYIVDKRNQGAILGWGCFINTAGKMMFFTANGSYNERTGTNTVPLNTWVHLAWSFSAGTARMFINGTLDSTFTGVVIPNPTVSVWIGRPQTYSSYLAGYISNLRIVKGTALYTANFTPSTSPLTAVSGTSLLTCQSNRFKDNSTNNAAITVYGDTKVVKDSPFPEVYDKTIQGGSAYFDGNGDYLSVPSSTNYDFSTGDFTIEAWVYWVGGASQCHILSRWGSNFSYRLYIDTDKLTFGNSISGAILVDTTALLKNTWVHVVLSKYNGLIRLFKNGILVSSASDTASYSTAATNITINALDSAGNGTMNGYISNLRVVKGTALYTANFTPPTAPLSAVANTSLLLKCDNAGIVDATGKNDLVTYGNAQVSTTQKKYGTGAMYFDGTGDYLTLPPDDIFKFGTGDFTVEGWVNQSANNTYSVFLEIGEHLTSAGIIFLVNNASARSASVFSAAFFGGETLPALSQWYHVAWVRSTGVLKIYVDGVSTGSVAFTNNISSNTTTIGYSRSTVASSGYYLNGYIDDLRITKGLARYTANFTPPTAPLTL
jgi:hypothetical protein